MAPKMSLKRRRIRCKELKDDSLLYYFLGPFGDMLPAGYSRFHMATQRCSRSGRLALDSLYRR